MFGIPVHPLVVHFPIVLVVLLPVFAAVALWAIRKGTNPRRIWAVPAALALALSLSAWVALETGESQEERVEDVVSESALHSHAESAERFLALSVVLLAVTGVGFMGGTVGRAARLVATVGAVGLIAAGVQVGHSGGSLVYRYGAASAYTNGTAPIGDRDGARGSRPSDGDEH